VQAPQLDTPIGDVSVEVDATRIGNDVGEHALWGVTCRSSILKGNLYVLGIRNNASPVIAKFDNNKGRILRVGSPTDAINKGMSTNHIRGDCVGSKLTLYVNDQKLLEREDDEFASGAVGLEVESANISFDNLLVSKRPHQ
jgi:hypothetical protein